jgi:hypothetical protein
MHIANRYVPREIANGTENLFLLSMNSMIFCWTLHTFRMYFIGKCSVILVAYYLFHYSE